MPSRAGRMSGSAYIELGKTGIGKTLVDFLMSYADELRAPEGASPDRKAIGVAGPRCRQAADALRRGALSA